MVLFVIAVMYKTGTGAWVAAAVPHPRLMLPVRIQHR